MDELLKKIRQLTEHAIVGTLLFLLQLAGGTK
jgi:hypothetical protein